jgi:hypothetical protein
MFTANNYRALQHHLVPGKFPGHGCPVVGYNEYGEGLQGTVAPFFFPFMKLEYLGNVEVSV